VVREFVPCTLPSGAPGGRVDAGCGLNFLEALITAFGDEQTHQQAGRLGAIAFLDKPFEIEQLIDKVREVVPR